MTSEHDFPCPNEGCEEVYGSKVRFKRHLLKCLHKIPLTKIPLTTEPVVIDLCEDEQESLGRPKNSVTHKSRVGTTSTSNKRKKRNVLASSSDDESVNKRRSIKTTLKRRMILSSDEENDTVSSKKIKSNDFDESDEDWDLLKTSKKSVTIKNKNRKEFSDRDGEPVHSKSKSSPVQRKRRFPNQKPQDGTPPKKRRQHEVLHDKRADTKAKEKSEPHRVQKGKKSQSDANSNGQSSPKLNTPEEATPPLPRPPSTNTNLNPQRKKTFVSPRKGFVPTSTPVTLDKGDSFSDEEEFWPNPAHQKSTLQEKRTCLQANITGVNHALNECNSVEEGLALKSNIRDMKKQLTRINDKIIKIDRFMTNQPLSGTKIVSQPLKTKQQPAKEKPKPLKVTKLNATGKKAVVATESTGNANNQECDGGEVATSTAPPPPSIEVNQSNGGNKKKECRFPMFGNMFETVAQFQLQLNEFLDKLGQLNADEEIKGPIQDLYDKCGVLSLDLDEARLYEDWKGGVPLEQLMFVENPPIFVDDTDTKNASPFKIDEEPVKNSGDSAASRNKRDVADDDKGVHDRAHESNNAIDELEPEGNDNCENDEGMYADVVDVTRNSRPGPSSARTADTLRTENPEQLWNPLNPWTETLTSSIPFPPLPSLDSIWEWNDVTGAPIFPDPDNVWRRFVPSTFVIPSRIDDPRFLAFVNGMTNGRAQMFEVDCNINDKGKPWNTVQCLLNRVLLSDIKKINVGTMGNILIFTKTSNPLIPFDDVYSLQALKADRKSIEELITEINLNSQRGYNGPGTFWCRHPKCKNRPLMTASPVVRWGPQPHQILNLRCRFTCASKNVVYSIHCDACLKENRFTTYCGETCLKVRCGRNSTTAHPRMHKHIDGFAHQPFETMYPRSAKDILTSTIAGIIEGSSPDNNNLMQDPFTHFTYKHSAADRRYTFLEGGFVNTRHRRGHEYLFTAKLGNFVYNNVQFHGNLNHLNSSD